MSHPLRTFARGKPCLVRLAGICIWDESTTILAHIRRANVAGTGQKPPDTCAVWACSACHNVIDGRAKYVPQIDLSELTRNELVSLVVELYLDRDLLEALVRQLAWYDKHEVLIPVISQGAAVRANPPALDGTPRPLSTEVEMT